MSNKDPTPNSVDSVRKAFSIIECLQENEMAGITEIAEKTNIPKSTVHSHLSTLVGEGYVVQENGQYRLGVRFLDHGLRAREQYEFLDVTKDTLQQVAEETQEMAWVVVEEQHKAVYIWREAGERAVQSHNRTGNRFDLHYTAAGKSILSEFSDTEIDAYIECNDLMAKTDKTLTTTNELWEDIERIRENGVAFNRQEETDSVRAVAAPIVYQGTVHGAISVSGPTNRLTGERFESTIPDVVLGATNEIELKMGFEQNK